MPQTLARQEFPGGARQYIRHISRLQRSPLPDRLNKWIHPFGWGGNMDIRSGDAVFLRNGEPGIVKDRSLATGKLTVDTDNETVKRDMRHGYLNGLTDTQRVELNTILDGVKTNTEDPTERISALETKVRELEADPRQIGLSKYVKAEMVHMMNSHGIKPREYSVQETKIR